MDETIVPVKLEPLPFKAKETVFYRPELDALRFFAFLAVFISHTLPINATFYADKIHLPPLIAALVSDSVLAGAGGVVLFFMLSSYLITVLLLREHKETGTIQLMSFYKRRALRIWPLYFSFLLFCVLILPRFGLPHLPSLHLLGFTTFTENWVVVFDRFPGPVFEPLWCAAPLWSLSVEEQFYLVWPLLILAVGVGRIWMVAAVCITLAVISRALMHAAGADVIRIWESTFSHIDSIVIGALIAHHFRNGLPERSKTERVILLLAGLAFPIISRVGIPEYLRYPAVTLGCALILLATLGWKVGPSLTTNALIYLGKISFGLYVFHVAFISFWDAILPKVVFVAPISFLCSVGMAAASYRWLEMPFLRLKKRFAVVESRSL